MPIDPHAFGTSDRACGLAAKNEAKRVIVRLGTVIASLLCGTAMRRKSWRADKPYLPFLSTPHRESGRLQAAAFICGQVMHLGK